MRRGDAGKPENARYFFFAVFFLAAFFLGAAFLAAFFLATVRPPNGNDGDFLAACRAGAEARQVRRQYSLTQI
jgi:hypothetical protein